MVRPVDPAQGAFDFGENPEKPQRGKVGPSEFDEELAKQREDRQEKARSRAAENEEFKDKRQPKSDMIRQAEIEKMKEILNKPIKTSSQASMLSPKGNVTAAGRGTAYGGGAGAESGFGIQKMNKALNRNYKSGGKVKSASARADGIAIRGKTRA